jgi:hypothetical protein
MALVVFFNLTYVDIINGFCPMREQDSESTNSQRGGAIIVHCCIVADKKKNRTSLIKKFSQN